MHVTISLTEYFLAHIFNCSQAFSHPFVGDSKLGMRTSNFSNSTMAHYSKFNNFNQDLRAASHVLTKPLIAAAYEE